MSLAAVSSSSSGGASFYKSGGTLSPDEPSYVARQADAELYQRLSAGEFCYVLTSRQMGKSSLMNRMATRLHREGIAVAQIDLTTIGQNLTIDQWYDGLIYEIGRCVNLKQQLRVCWQANAALGPLQRFIATLRDGLLTTFFQPVVIFVDEIEVVRSLNFSTDEFFAAIRECYNRRAIDPEMKRLTFCLLGMATPHDLIEDARITPFNVGKRIDLTDFTPAEANQLASGMCDGGRDGSRLLKRVIHWTNGQPYLSQRLCQAVAEDLTATDEAAVDRLCRELFLSEHARESEPNLVPLREYVLRSAPDRAAILDLYQKVRAGRYVSNDAADVNVEILQLSGITRAEGGTLRVRNRIYFEVFNRAWITANMPDAELRRQRAASIRAFAVSASIFGSIALLAIAAFIVAVVQYRQARIEERQKSVLLYRSDMNLGADALERHDVAQDDQILRGHIGDKMDGFEYGYLWKACHSDYYTFQGLNEITGVSFSPDNRYVACASVDGSINIIDVMSRQMSRSVSVGMPTPYAAVEFDPVGPQLAAISGQSVTVWETGRWAKTHIIPESGLVSAIDYSRDGNRIAVAAGDGVAVYDTSTWKLVTRIKSGDSVYCVRFSPISDELATAERNSLVRVWNASTGALLHTLTGQSASVRALAFDPTGGILASAGEDHLLITWDTATWQPHTLFMGSNTGRALVFVSGSTLADGGNDTAVEFWNLATQSMDGAFDGHKSTIWSLACSPNGRWLASASWDRSVKLWDLRKRSQFVRPQTSDSTSSYAFSGDGLEVASHGQGNRIDIGSVQEGHSTSEVEAGGAIGAWALNQDGRQIAISGTRHVSVFGLGIGGPLWQFDIPSDGPDINSVALAPDGQSVAVGGHRGEVQIWRFPGRLAVNLANGKSGATVTSMAFSDDGRVLATGSHNASISLYTADSGQLIGDLVGHHGDVLALAFTHNGRELASCGADGTVKLWNMGTRQEVMTLATKTGRPSSLAFDQNDLKLVMIDQDGLLHEWDSASAEDVSAALREAVYSNTD